MSGKLLILAAVVTACVCIELEPKDKNFLHKIFEPVDPTDRKQALSHQVVRGYILKNPSWPSFEIPQKDTLRIYDIILKNFKVPSTKELQTRICFPDGTCIDTDDSGAYPI